MKSNAGKQLIIDTTLRDGEQGAGVVFSLEQRKRIAEMLSCSGVDEIEAGTPVMSEEDVGFLKWAARFDLPVFCWCRADDRDIEAAKRTGLSGIHVSVPVSDRLLGIFEKDRSWVEHSLLKYSGICFSDFDRVSIGFMDASRAEPAFLGYLTGLARSFGYDRVRIADSAGVMTPLEVASLVSDLSGHGIEIEFHAHNDMGMATANAVTAFDSGAGAVSATVLGLGERAGNACLEEIAFARKSRGQSSGIDMSVISELGRYISGITDKPIPVRKPVLGGSVFSHETGIHAAAVLKDPLAFLPADPGALGLGEQEICAGRHSGTQSIMHILAGRSLAVSRSVAAELLPLVRLRAGEYGRNLTAGELERIYYEYTNTEHCDKGILQGL